ncbi:MAG TPA: pectate lyase [Verrucomicrobiales bacterium]|nr:pectate lyase [Verrucomicrobiales bacterium]
MASVRVISKLTGRWAPTGLLALFFGTSAATVARDRTWRDCLAEDADWYRSAEAVRIADNILYYQAEIGGWYKNDNSVHPSGHAATETLTEQQRTSHRELLRMMKFPCTLDNGATHSELRYLAAVCKATGKDRFREGFARGIRYLLKAQYPSGGWPQFYPLRPGYSSRITFNDGAMIGALAVLDATARECPPFDITDQNLRQGCILAVERGISCILRCQIRDGKQLTAWCQQHEEVSLAPAQGRISELPSISGAESVGVVRYLMSIEDPSMEIVEAVEGAVRWFRQVAVPGIRVVTVDDASLPGGKDRKVIRDAKADPVWARYYEIGTNRPMFIERGEVKYSLAELSHSHRVGHGWIGGRWPAGLLAAEYPVWRRKYGKLQD